MAIGKQKKSKKKIIIFSTIGVLVIALALIAFLGGKRDEIVPIQIEKASIRTITQSVTATGTLDPEFKVVITPEVTGEIVELPVKEGDFVKKGQLLIKIKSDAYRAQVQQSEASLNSAKATLSMNKAQLDKVTADYNRTKQLRAKNLASDSDLETAKSTYLSAKGAYEGAQAQIQQMQAALKVQLDQLSKTTIYSPMTGTVSQLNVELGERVLGSGFSQGTNVMTISDLKSMLAVVDVDENDVVLVSPGDTARIKIDAFGDKVFKGIVYQIGNSALTTGTSTQDQVVNFEVKLKFLDFDNNFRPGMSCNASIETKTLNNVLSVPIQSVTARSNMSEAKQTQNASQDNQAKKKENGNKIQEIVFVVNKNKAKAVNVKTGISDDNYIQIIDGLKQGQEVVTGSYKAISTDLHDGSDVKVESKSKMYSNQ
ncbi:MAG TPA: efflux RND transporter periplasmic adaptor subunit [Ignavibacteriaceae bacterium]|nr:efflux RND transporter periplasmic adaptor subunit [Ignavibacteriaceae bacterium]